MEGMPICSVLICLVFWSSNVFALIPIPLEPPLPCFTHFGECIRYCPGERIPDLEEIESSCITNMAGYQFCKFYHCPPTRCRRRNKDLYGKCYYCSGDCIDGGKIHKNGQGFLSFDMVNSCFCGQGNSKHCTKRPVDQFSYCNHARPDKVEHSKVVIVDRPPPPPPPQIVAYVPRPPTQPPAPQAVAYVPPPTQPATPPPFAFVPHPGNNQQRVVAHPNFSAKSPKTNLEQRSHNNPNLYRYNQRFHGYPNNPFFGQFPWGYNPFNQESEM